MSDPYYPGNHALLREAEPQDNNQSRTFRDFLIGYILSSVPDWKFEEAIREAKAHTTRVHFLSSDGLERRRRFRREAD